MRIITGESRQIKFVKAGMCFWFGETPWMKVTGRVGNLEHRVLLSPLGRADSKEYTEYAVRLHDGLVDAFLPTANVDVVDMTASVGNPIEG